MAMNHRTITLVALVLFLLLAAPLSAGVSEVRDPANLFFVEAVEKANLLIKKIQKQHGKDFLVETVKVPNRDLKKLDSDDKDHHLKNMAAERAKAANVNGIYSLICKEPPGAEVEVIQWPAFTPEYRKRLMDLVGEKMREASRTRGQAEKRRLHDQALLDGIAYVAKVLDAGTGKVGDKSVPIVGDKSVPSPAPDPKPEQNTQPAGTPEPAPQQQRLGPGLWLWFGVGATLLALGMLAFGLVKVIGRKPAKSSASPPQSEAKKPGKPALVNPPVPQPGSIPLSASVDFGNLRSGGHYDAEDFGMKTRLQDEG